MSEYLTKESEKQTKLKEIIKRLHGGATVAEVKKDFSALIKDVSAEEVAAMEQALVNEGFPVEEIMRLCEVHVAVFEASLQKGAKPGKIPGHPVHSFMAENREASALARRLLAAARTWAWGLGNRSAEARAALDELAKIAIHYARKENQLFPYLERKGFTGPSKVMWGKHDEIRAALKSCDAAFRSAVDRAGVAAFHGETRKLAASIRRMIFMEERILLPNALSKLSEREWAEIRSGEEAIGFAWIKPGAEYDAPLVLARERKRDQAAGGGESLGSAFAAPAKASAEGGRPVESRSAAASAQAAEAPASMEAHNASKVIELATGALAPELLDLVLKRLPLDVSVVDENDRVLYYSDSPERLFPRSPAIIGRSVKDCHPPKSVAVVERILDSFKKKEKNEARFWIEMGGKFAVIEYRALYDASGAYRGTLETSYDAAGIRALKGERRLLEWD